MSTAGPVKPRIVWSDPPWGYTPKPGRPPKWAPMADALRERPGKWGMIGEAEPSLMTAIKQGRRGFAPAGRTKGKRRIWARFVGDPT
jgi:hypothetical protein